MAAYKALTYYLEAAGRWNVLGSELPIWTRHDRARAPGVSLTSRAFVENLETYARQAGLSHIHSHQTRSTDARIVAEETGSFIEAQEALDYENQSTTCIYARTIMGAIRRKSRATSSNVAPK